ncbi:hypothetical protein KR222_005873, partial [Zaprionus bogoriensis]
QFLTKSSSARRTLLALLLALCFLSCALGAKITKKLEQSPTDGDNKADNAEAAAKPAAAATADEDDDDDDEEEAAEEDNDDDDDDDDDEEEQQQQQQQKQKQSEQQQQKKKQKKPADKEAAASDKNELQAGVDPTDLSVWGMVRTLWGWLRSDLSESLFGDDDEKPAAVEGRTFGKIRRLQMALIPIIFKFGVLSAMVAFLVAIGMKSLFLLKVLVVMNALAILGKFLTLKTSLFGQYENTAPSFSYPGWNAHAKESSWAPTGLSGPPPAPHPPSKEIHLHIHGNAQTQAQLAGQGYNYETAGGWASRSDPYGGYLPTGQYQEQQQQQVRSAEVPNITDPMSLLPTKYPARSLIR